MLWEFFTAKIHHNIAEIPAVELFLNVVPAHPFNVLAANF
jgi:hypothetical protein